MSRLWLRTPGLMGPLSVVEWIWSLVMTFCALFAAMGLWHELVWPTWLLVITLIGLYYLKILWLIVVFFVAFIAGFFKGAWEWSIFLGGVSLFWAVGNMVLGIMFMKAFEKQVSRLADEQGDEFQ